MARIIAVFLLAVLLATPALAQSAEPFESWLRDLGRDAAEDGVSDSTIASALRMIELDNRVMNLDQSQPENTITFQSYAKGVAKAERIKRGVARWRANREDIADASQRYGVPSSVIVALWGIESSFGHDSGSFSIVDSLATLAYQGRRTEFFRRELIAALHILDEEHMEPQNLRGSWAGAMGQCQFMPSTYLKHAVDGDGDGRRDIWENNADVFASIANYLAAEGWKRGQGWGREVKLSRPVAKDHIGLDYKASFSEWSKQGVRLPKAKMLPASTLQASLILPDGPGGRAFLVYDNFRALMRWNRSTYFATTVGLMADQLNAAFNKTK